METRRLKNAGLKAVSVASFEVYGNPIKR